jgi:hypothetical protein
MVLMGVARATADVLDEEGCGAGCMRLVEGE